MSAASTFYDLAHRYGWQALPKNLRRQALIVLSAACAPRPDPTPDRHGPVIVGGFLTAATGLGASARLCHDALLAAGLPVLGIDLSKAFRQDASRIDFPFVDGSRHVGGGSLILHVNAPFVPLALWRIGRRVTKRKLVVGCWAWELPDVPSEWRAGVPLVHRAIVPSTFTRDAIARMAPHLPIDVVPYAVAAPITDQRMRRAARSEAFTVLVVFNMASGFERKNPLAAVDAFRRAFGDDDGARLTIKMLNGDAYKKGADTIRHLGAAHRNITVDERTLSQAGMRDLYGEADVVLSLHRSEGFGLVVAEAMLAGLPVVATDWSGNTDFLNSGNGVPVKATLAPAIDPDGEYHNPDSSWADADVTEAAQALVRLRSDRPSLERLGKNAQRDARRLFAPDRYAEAMVALLALAGHSHDVMMGARIHDQMSSNRDTRA